MIVPAIALIIGVSLGCVIAYLAFRGTFSTLREELKTSRADSEQLRTRLEAEQQARTRAETELKSAREQMTSERSTLERAREQLKDAFGALAADALGKNNEAFLTLAATRLKAVEEHAALDLDQRQKAVRALVDPIQERLGKFDEEIRKLEDARQQSYGALSNQLASLAESQTKLQSETGKLVQALRSPNVRGRWGEIQLRRVVEIAGMLPHCDFVEQETVVTADGRLRPDMIVHLPGGKNIVVDSKAPLSAYLDAIEAQDEDVRRSKLEAHAAQIRNHIARLSAKAYWDQFEPTPDFVVMFLPGETFFSEALAHDPSLIEEAVNQRVMIASPITLIALLRTVAYGWRQETIAAGAQAISDLGKELYDRLCTMGSYFASVGHGLDNAVKNYNKAVGSLESRVLVTARKFSELGAATKQDIPEAPRVESTARILQSPEWSPASLFKLAATADDQATDDEKAPEENH